MGTAESDDIPVARQQLQHFALRFLHGRSDVAEAVFSIPIDGQTRDD